MAIGTKTNAHLSRTFTVHLVQLWGQNVSEKWHFYCCLISDGSICWLIYAKYFQLLAIFFQFLLRCRCRRWYYAIINTHQTSDNIHCFFVSRTVRLTERRTSFTAVSSSSSCFFTRVLISIFAHVFSWVKLTLRWNAMGRERMRNKSAHRYSLECWWVFCRRLWLEYYFNVIEILITTHVNWRIPFLFFFLFFLSIVLIYQMV